MKKTMSLLSIWHCWCKFGTNILYYYDGGGNLVVDEFDPMIFVPRSNSNN